MKVFLIAALTADGFIARSSTELADWTSKEDKKLFVELTKRAGVMVMGSSTYKTIGRALPGRRNIVYTRQTIVQEGIETTQLEPAKLLAKLAAEGHSEVAICGGRSIYNLFLEAGLIDELYITIAPLLFGTGITLAAMPLDIKLGIMDSRMLNDNTMLIHYEVKK